MALMTKPKEEEASKGSTRRARTRSLLKKAALKRMARDGFHDLRIVDICKEAGVAVGTFYVHFRDKIEIAVEVVEEIIAENERYILSAPPIDDPYDAIYESNRRYIELIANDPVFSRAIPQLIDVSPEFRLLWDESNARLAQIMAKALAKRCPASGDDDLSRLLIAHAAQGMLDAVLLLYFGRKNQDLMRAAGDREELTEKLSILWYRIFYGCDPANEKISSGAGILKVSLSGWSM